MSQKRFSNVYAMASFVAIALLTIGCVSIQQVSAASSTATHSLHLSEVDANNRIAACMDPIASGSVPDSCEAQLLPLATSLENSYNLLHAAIIRNLDGRIASKFAKKFVEQAEAENNLVALARGLYLIERSAPVIKSNDPSIEKGYKLLTDNVGSLDSASVCPYFKDSTYLTFPDTPAATQAQLKLAKLCRASH